MDLPFRNGQFKQLLKEIHETLVWRSLVVKLSYSELQIISFFKQHETLMNLTVLKLTSKILNTLQPARDPS